MTQYTREPLRKHSKCISFCIYLGGEGVTVDVMLRAPVVILAIVDMYFLELVLVRQWTTRDVDVMSCGVVHSEHDTVPCVADTTAHLHQQQTTYVSFNLKMEVIFFSEKLLYSPIRLQDFITKKSTT